MDIYTVIVSAGTGAAVSGLFAIIAIYVQRRAEERKQIRELAVQIAFENWKGLREREPDKADLRVLAAYTVHAIQLVSVLDGRLKTTDQIAEHFRRTNEFIDAAANPTNKKYNKPVA